MTGGARFNVLIVGAGPAGCVLANRLTEDAACTVALLEAGPDYGSDQTSWPPDLRDPTSVWTESHSWEYAHVERSQCPPLPLPRARVVGGTSTVNGCIWLRGSAADYDAWATLGNPGWSFTELLPYFRRAESDPNGGPLHGSNGPVPVFRAPSESLTPIDRAIVAAADALGFPAISDFNGTAHQSPGVGPTPKNIASGIRMNAAFTYLAPARHRPNLAIISNAPVDRIVIDDGRATGVRLADGRIVHAENVVLSAGTYGSPAILLRSGIGPATHLQELGIPVVADRPGVGECLLDHPLVTGVMEAVIAPEAAPAATSFMPVMIKARSRGRNEEVDLHIYEGQSFDEVLGRWTLWLSVSLQDARSRGRVRLTSPDPAATLDIDHCYFSDPADLDAACDGVELANRLIATQPLANVVTPIPERTLRWGDHAELQARVRAQIGTTFHPSSTCRMGPGYDPLAVVDHAGKVYGINGLRVVDASIFPAGPRANIHFTTVAVAEKLAESMRHDPRK